MTTVVKCSDPALVERIERGVRAGAPVADACQAAGVHPASWRSWMVRGEALHSRMEAAGITDPPDDVSENDVHCLAFFARMKEAESAAKVEALAVVRRAIVGWDEDKTTTTTKRAPLFDENGRPVLDANGEARTFVVSETTVVTTGRKFSWAAAMTWLERRYPTEFARLTRAEVSGPDGGPIEFEDAEDLRAHAIEVVNEVQRRREQRELAERQHAERTAIDAPSRVSNGNGTE